MKGYWNRIIIYIAAGIALTGLLWLMQSGNIIPKGAEWNSAVHLLETPCNPLESEVEIAGRQKALILYSKGDYESEKLLENIQKTCTWMKIDTDEVEAKKNDTVSYPSYDIVVIATAYTEEELGNALIELFHYVEAGGKLLWAINPWKLEEGFRSIYRKLGIIEYGEYIEINEYSFAEELIPGSKGLTFSGEEFTDTAMQYRLEDYCKVYLETIEEQIPLIWSTAYGKGKSVFCNMTALSEKFHTGVLCGCILALQEEFLYPVLNAKTVFLDDFPSMQYNSESMVIQEEYNRTVKAFYRDIWWPDMQSVAKRYGLKYTGLFIATYDDIVNPELFFYEKDEMEQYYGNSLRNNGFELGIHGYNHQSLTLSGGTPEELEYKPWANLSDMKASLEFFQDITKELFGNVKLYSYVPPSNYLSKEGRQAVVETFPDLKCISGVYTGVEVQEDVYIQDFELSEDGIAEFPRVTSGMLESDYEDYAMINAAGLYGVFSHFLHPDDILDEERGNGLTWKELLNGFCKKLSLLNERYEKMRALTAAEAADGLKIAYCAEISYEVTETKIYGKIYNYYGDGYFYLKSEKQPYAASEGCTITALNSLYQGDIYLVHIETPEFVITLK